MTSRSRVLIVAVFTLAACTPASSSPAEPPSPQASERPTASEEPSPSSSTGGTPGPSEAAFSCEMPISGGATIDIAHLADVRVGTHPGYDRITFEYVEAGTPEYRIDSAQAPFSRDPSDLPMSVAGTQVFVITLLGGTKVGDDGSPTYTGPTDFEPGYPQLRQLVERGDFEAVNSWYLGLNGGECVRAVALSEPSRVVIDVQH